MERARRKTRIGIVISDARTKTVTVEVRDVTRHPRYGKTMPVAAKYHVHDETSDAHIGDTVRIVETRPLSKTKRWRLDEVLERAR